MLLLLILADAAVADSIFAVVLAVLSQIFAQAADADAVLLLLTLADAAVDSIFVVESAVLSQIFAQVVEVDADAVHLTLLVEADVELVAVVLES